MNDRKPREHLSSGLGHTLDPLDRIVYDTDGSRLDLSPVQRFTMEIVRIVSILLCFLGMGCFALLLFLVLFGNTAGL